MACGSCKTCVARCSNHPVSCGHAPSQRPSPMISQKLSEPPHNLPMKSEPALADLHRIPDATLQLVVHLFCLPRAGYGGGGGRKTRPPLSKHGAEVCAAIRV